MRIKRDAFLYLEGDDKHFAQCGTCVFFYKKRCKVMGNTIVSQDGSCGLYLDRGPDGEPYSGDDALGLLSKQQAGYVERQVRCENCKFFSAGECMLFHKLNGIFPELFDLNEKVDRYGCCNAQTPE